MNFLFVSLNLLGLAKASIYEDWHPAGPNDVRSPCPALNSLANVHIPHTPPISNSPKWRPRIVR
ncbi:predicted protein [Plenodomus lingam JN3]|uniref:Predicted protein n=1 Tax=Leptosphaeria maculans (strain JN3 / isolate v23.1.3 / race Av1-4-5-6-7-8) TaxID=985895 RepID=E4ZTC1_LEPMJ|nr:predicted protein [Plenodomus lingam JN3]CBX94777.1 predicted protein [Plenodomus lingam JN3]